MIFFRGCWKYGPIIRETIENVQFAVQIEIFQKTPFFALTPPTLGSVAQTTHALNSVPARFFDPRRDLLRKKFGGP